MSEGPEQQQWGGLPGGGRASWRRQAWALRHRIASVRERGSSKSSWRSNAHPREHITSYTLSVVVMATVATIIVNFQKTLMLDIIYRVFWDKCHCDSHTPHVAQVVKNPLANAGDAWDLSLIPGSGRSLEKEIATHSSISCLENSMDRGAWRATVHGVTKSQIWLSMVTLDDSHMRKLRCRKTKALAQSPI